MTNVLQQHTRIWNAKMEQNKTVNCQQLFVSIVQENSSSVIIFAVVSACTTLFAISGNIIFLTTVAVAKSLHTPSNALLAVLCATDLLVGMFVQPLFHTIQIKELTTGEVPTVLILIYVFVLVHFTGWSCWLITFISIDRLIAICYPFYYQRAVTCKRYLAVCGVSFVLLLIYAIVATITRQYVLYRLSSLIGIIVTLIAIAICYIRILKVILRKCERVQPIGQIDNDKGRETCQQKKETAKTYIIAVIVCVFIICYTPTAIYSTLITLKPAFCATQAFFLLFNSGNVCVTLNSCINPIIYCFRSTDIRKEARRIFMKEKCRTNVVPSKCNESGMSSSSPE